MNGTMKKVICGIRALRHRIIFRKSWLISGLAARGTTMEYSPNAGNRNSIRTVVLTNREEIGYIGKAHTTIIENFNRGIVTLPTEEAIEKSPSAFHNAPMVIALFGPKNFYFSPADAYILAQNMALEAYEQGGIHALWGKC